MVSRWGQPSTCYLVVKLKKCTKCPAGQIVKYKLNNKENLFFCISVICRSLLRREYNVVQKFQNKKGPYYRALEYKFCFGLQGVETKEL